MVAEPDGDVVAWASLSEWPDRCAYADTAEMSIYVREEFRGRRVGRRLMDAIMEEGEKMGLHTVIARITDGNSVSVHLHESAG